MPKPKDIDIENEVIPRLNKGYSVNMLVKSLGTTAKTLKKILSPELLKQAKDNAKKASKELFHPRYKVNGNER